MNRQLYRGAAVALLVAGSATLHAEEVKVNGFLTTSLTKLSTSETSYMGGSFTNQARFDNPDSRLGLQFSAQVSERIDATAQLLARGRGDNNSIATDWAFVSIKANDDTKIRTGKLKLATFLTSDYIEVGYAYPWIRPPQELYGLNPITTQVGVDALYTPKIGKAKLMIQPFMGSNRGTTTISAQQADAYDQFFTANPLATIGDWNASNRPMAGESFYFNVPSMYGLNLSLSNRIATVRAGYLQARVDQPDLGFKERLANFASAGVTVDWHDIVLYSEVAMRDVETSLEQAFPDQRSGYITLGYRMGKFMPHLTYAGILAGGDPDPTAAALTVKQRSVTAGLRYEFLDGAALKFEVQRIDPEENNYGLFDGKDSNGNYLKDARLYGIALDVIF